MTNFALGQFRLDTDSGLLLRGTEPVALGSRAIALLRALVERPGALVSKDALIEAAWHGLAVADGNLTVQIAALRRALGEEPGGDGWIETMPRRGYRFIGPVVTEVRNGVVASRPQADVGRDSAPMTHDEVERGQSAATPRERAGMAFGADGSGELRIGKSPGERALPLLPDKPSIAVLPFQNMSGAPEQDYFADGMVEEIITALSRIRWLFVIARNSSFTYKGQTVDVKQIGRELGVRYVLEGSVRKAGGRVRITAQLIEAETGTHLWADRFDGSLDAIFDLQDQVAINVAGIIEPTLRAAEVRRAVGRPRPDPTAYDVYLRALRATDSWEKQDHMEALDRLSHVIGQDAAYGPALALSALYNMVLYGNAWTDDPEATRQNAIWFARRAVRSAGADAETLGRAACVLAYCGEDIDAATALVDWSLRINPSFAEGWRWNGWLRLWAGSPDVAIDHFERSLRLNPLGSSGGTLVAVGMAHFFARRLDQARTMLSRSIQQYPDWVPTNRFLAACYAHLGELDEAKMMIKRLRALTPAVLPTADHWRDPEQREFYLSGLRLAMSATDEAASLS